MSITNDPFTAVAIGLTVVHTMDRAVNREYYEKEEEKRKKKLEEERIQDSIRWSEKHSKPKQMKKDDIDNIWTLRKMYEDENKIKYELPIFIIKLFAWLFTIFMIFCAEENPEMYNWAIFPTIIVIFISVKLIQYTKRKFWMNHKNDYAQ